MLEEALCGTRSKVLPYVQDPEFPFPMEDLYRPFLCVYQRRVQRCAEACGVRLAPQALGGFTRALFRVLSFRVSDPLYCEFHDSPSSNFAPLVPFIDPTPDALYRRFVSRDGGWRHDRPLQA